MEEIKSREGWEKMKHTIFKYTVIGIATGVIVSLLKKRKSESYTNNRKKRKRQIARRKHKGNIREGNWDK